MHLSGMDVAAGRSTPPTLGQHEEILSGELGLGGEDIERLRERKVIGTRPDFEI